MTFDCVARQLLSPPRCAQFVSAADIDISPLPLKVEVAFPDVKWPGWMSTEESGIVDPLRPVLVTHAGDGTNRVFIPTQQGVIYVLPNDQKATTAKVFLDLNEKVAYNDKTNEEGFLGLAFHPKYRENGQFFVYYTNKAKKHQNVVARYRVSKDDPNRADPASEEILLAFDKPFWNHDGGTLAFGPDGYLYIAVGDGGLANDPYGNGQKLSTLLGKMLRIDVDHKLTAACRTPFRRTTRSSASRTPRPRSGPMDCAMSGGWRSIPRPEFCGPADVGQDLWEEIDLIVKGGNYGWNIREGLHPFVQEGGKPPPATRSDRPDRPDLGIPPRRRQVDHRRSCLPRQESSRARRRLSVRRLRHRQTMGSVVRRRAEDRDRQSRDPARRPSPSCRLAKTSRARSTSPPILRKAAACSASCRRTDGRQT